MACPSPSIGLALLASRWEVRLIFRTGSTPTKRSCSSSIRKKTFTPNRRRWWVDTRAYGCRVLGYAEDLPIFKHHYEETTDTILLSWTRIVSPTMVNEFNIGMVGEKEKSPAANLFGRTPAN